MRLLACGFVEPPDLQNVFDDVCGLVTRTVHPAIPPRVEYELTALGRSLGEAFCGVWIWAERHSEEIERVRAAFKTRE